MFLLKEIGLDDICEILEEFIIKNIQEYNKKKKKRIFRNQENLFSANMTEVNQKNSVFGNTTVTVS